jgi:hypothetical protein
MQTHKSHVRNNLSDDWDVLLEENSLEKQADILWRIATRTSIQSFE